jgi:GNAT superfamily N-acetyltransferase
VRTPTVPGYWDYNVVRVEGPAPGLEADALIAAADVLQQDLQHRKLEIEDEGTGERLRGAFAAAGWQTERLAFMRRDGPPPAPDPAVEEAPFADTRALRAEWYADSGDPGAYVEFTEAQEAINARRGLRAFVIREAGAPVGFASLAGGPEAVEVDQLYLTPARRGGGRGRALLETALAAGGAPVARIVADDEGRARPLYERTGFITVWRPYWFVRVPT